MEIRMTYVEQLTAAAGTGFFSRIADGLHRRKIARQIRDELASLSDRDLADLGISRLNVPEIALQAARNA
jgi:uncharacterized protein YjiS (DUF1127 family)